MQLVGFVGFAAALMTAFWTLARLMKESARDTGRIDREPSMFG